MNHQYPHSTKYNHKELQTELRLQWYDYGARNDDYAIERFMSVSPADLSINLNHATKDPKAGVKEITNQYEKQ